MHKTLSHREFFFPFAKSAGAKENEFSDSEWALTAPQAKSKAKSVHPLLPLVHNKKSEVSERWFYAKSVLN